MPFAESFAGPLAALSEVHGASAMSQQAQSLSAVADRAPSHAETQRRGEPLRLLRVSASLRETAWRSVRSRPLDGNRS